MTAASRCLIQPAAYSDSEEKIGYAMSDIRNHIYITTKPAAQNAEEFSEEPGDQPDAP